MKSNLRDFPGKYHYFLIFFFMAVLITSAGNCREGIGLKDDSFVYIFTAENLADGNGFRTYDGPTIMWAPLLSVILAGPVLLGIDPVTASEVIYPLMFATLVVLAGAIVLGISGSRLFATLSMAFALLSKPNYWMSTNLLSELPFNLLVLLSLFTLYLYLDRNRRYLLWLSIVFAALSSLTRYIGVTLVLTGCVVLFFHGGRKRFVDRLKDPFLFGAFSSLPTAVYLLRNRILTGTLVGERYGSLRGPLTNMLITYNRMMHWFIPEGLPGYVWVPLSLLIIGVFGFLILLLARRVAKRRKMKNHYLVFIYFIVFYTAYLLISASSVGFDKLNDRFFSPVYVPLTIIFVLLLHEVHEGSIFRPLDGPSHPGGMKKAFRASAIIFAVILLSGALHNVSDDLERDMNEGTMTYNRPEWREAEIFEYLSGSNLSGRFYSNFPNQVKYYTGIEDLDQTPRRNVRETPVELDELEEFGNWTRGEDEVYIIWITIAERGHLNDIEEIDEMYELELIADPEGGEVYRFIG